jgi:hypothetical protein
VALVISLLLRGGTTTLLGAAAEQTADSAQATSTAEGTPAVSGTTTLGTPAPHGTATPRLAASVEIVTKVATPSAPVPVIATCPSGELALSGGWTTSIKSVPFLSSKRNGNGWQVIPNPATSTQSTRVAAYVVCLQHLAGATVTERRATSIVNANSDGQTTAECNPGEIAVGGGFAIDSSELEQLALDPNLTAYRMTVKNNTSFMQTPTVYVECLSAAHSHILIPPPQGERVVAASVTVGINVSCPQDRLLVGGGFNDSSTTIAQIADFWASGANTWEAIVIGGSGGSSTVDVFAMCLSFS